MPNIWTHNWFGDKIAEQSKLYVLPTDLETRNLYHLGCQGPDFLFYHHYLPWHGTSAMNKLGSRLHREFCGPILLDMAKTLKEQQAKPNDPLTHYVLGFMMHHVLDRNMHPYVFCKSGSIKWNHQRFEVIMDTLVMKQVQDIDTWATPVWKQIYIGLQLPNAISTMMGRITQTYFPEFNMNITASDWNDAYRDMIQAQKIFHDPYGIKRVITFGQIEPLVYKRRNKQLDYLNEARAPWSHPAVPEEVSTASFWDLWTQAMTDGLNVWQAAEQYLFGDNQDQDQTIAYNNLVEAIGNLSYEHGKSCDAGLEIIHEEPIWT
ncbi:MAG: hypothetical protein WDZ91_14650 [Paenibacillaceae bacterium]